MKPDHIGFEKTKLRKEYGNKPCDVTIDGKDCHFRSLFDYRFAQVLLAWKYEGRFDDWGYETRECKFFPPGHSYGAVHYLCDFVTFHSDGHLEFYECKGKLERDTIEKFKMVQAGYKAIIIFLVVAALPKSKRARSKGAAKRATIERFTEDIIEANPLFRKFKVDMTDPGQTFQPEYRGRRNDTAD